MSLAHSATSLALALLLLPATGSLLHAAPPTPLLQWSFNEGIGTETTSGGSAGEAVMTFSTGSDESAETFSADAEGVSGQPGDYALNLSAATGMGASQPPCTGPAGKIAGSEPGIDSLSGLKSFTLTGWLKPSATTLTAAARIIVSNVFSLQAGSAGELQLSINSFSDPNAYLNSEPAYQEVGNWMFFAVTFNAAETGDNVAYYLGDVSGNLTTAGTGNINSPAPGDQSGPITIGNNGAGGPRPFQGLIDDLAIYGSNADASGALSEEQLREVLKASLAKP